MQVTQYHSILQLQIHTCTCILAINLPVIKYTVNFGGDRQKNDVNHSMDHKCLVHKGTCIPLLITRNPILTKFVVLSYPGIGLPTYPYT